MGALKIAGGTHQRDRSGVKGEDQFGKILESKQTELETLIRNRDGISIERSADALDEIQHATQRELAIRNLDRESNLLRNVREALERIDGDTYGVCLRCDEEISPKRLAALPWAGYCLHCQERIDRSLEAGGEQLFDDLTMNAA